MRNFGLKVWDSNYSTRPGNVTVQLDFYGSATDEMTSFKEGVVKFEESVKSALMRDSTKIFKNGKTMSEASLNAKWIPTIKSDIDGQYSDKIPIKIPSKLVDGETVIDLDQVEFYNDAGEELALYDVMERFEEKHLFDAILQPVKLNFYGSKVSMPLVAVQIKFHGKPVMKQRDAVVKGLGGCVSKKRGAEEETPSCDDAKRAKN